MFRIFSIIIAMLMTLTFGCSHLVPLPARKMPIVKVLHQGKIEAVPLERYVASVLAGKCTQRGHSKLSRHKRLHRAPLRYGA